MPNDDHHLLSLTKHRLCAARPLFSVVGDAGQRTKDMVKRECFSPLVHFALRLLNIHRKKNLRAL